MTKNVRCRICELLGENQALRHSCELTSGHLRPPGLSYATVPNMNYVNHGLLNGLYLPQLKDMMLAAYLLRGKDRWCKREFIVIIPLIPRAPIRRFAEASSSSSPAPSREVPIASARERERNAERDAFVVKDDGERDLFPFERANFRYSSEFSGDSFPRDRHTRILRP